MNLEYAMLLAVIQGLTEFLPISSSAHLILPSAVLGWVDQGLAFDVAVHLGSLIAVILALRVRLGRLIKGVCVGMGRRYPSRAVGLDDCCGNTPCGGCWRSLKVMD